MRAASSSAARRGELFTEPWHPYTLGPAEFDPAAGGRAAAPPALDPRQPALAPRPAAGLRLRAALPAPLRRAATEQPALAGAGGHEAACFISPEQRSRRAPRAAGRSRRRRDRALRPTSAAASRRSTSRSISPSAAACCRGQRRTRLCRRRRLASRSARARPWGWWANPAAANPPSARCLVRLYELTAGRLLLDGPRHRALEPAASCGRSGARCRWCSRIPTPRSIRAGGSAI